MRPPSCATIVQWSSGDCVARAWMEVAFHTTEVACHLRHGRRWA